MAHNGFKDVLQNGGFRAFLWTQFLGAYNDQVYQSIVMMYALKVRGEGLDGEGAGEGRGNRSGD